MATSLSARRSRADAPNALCASIKEIGKAAMTDEGKRYEEWLNGEVMISFINLPIEPEVVEPVVVEPLTARQRAHRIWRMEEKKPE
jgi:hypothetical protein